MRTAERPTACHMPSADDAVQRSDTSAGTGSVVSGLRAGWPREDAWSVPPVCGPRMSAVFCAMFTPPATIRQPKLWSLLSSVLWPKAVALNTYLPAGRLTDRTVCSVVDQVIGTLVLDAAPPVAPLVPGAPGAPRSPFGPAGPAGPVFAFRSARLAFLSARLAVLRAWDTFLASEAALTARGAPKAGASREAHSSAATDSDSRKAVRRRVVMGHAIPGFDRVATAADRMR